MSSPSNFILIFGKILLKFNQIGFFRYEGFMSVRPNPAANGRGAFVDFKVHFFYLFEALFICGNYW